MSDVYICDANRILIDANIGNVQAWPASPADVSVAVSVCAGVQHQPSKTAYIMQTLNLTAADARNLALALIKAADHADKMQIIEAANLGEAA